MNRKVDHKIILAKKKLRKLSKNYKQNFKNIENYIKKEIYEIKRSNKLSNNIIFEQNCINHGLKYIKYAH